MQNDTQSRSSEKFDVKFYLYVIKVDINFL